MAEKSEAKQTRPRSQTEQNRQQRLNKALRETFSNERCRSVKPADTRTNHKNKNQDKDRQDNNGLAVNAAISCMGNIISGAKNAALPLLAAG